MKAVAKGIFSSTYVSIKATSKPVSPEDMLATIYHALGISPDSEFHDQLARPHRAVEGSPLLELFG